jgi:2-polyprenyl-3-methyl-5-hydroxy-6-metoxy-1,4-benzoquinol methylase
MTDIDKKHQEKFINVWLQGNYRNGSTADRMREFLFSRVSPEVVINDYGCGTGRLEVWWVVARPHQKINMIDITKECLEEKIISIIENNRNIKFFEEDLSNMSSVVPKADWGFCINVLMTVQADKLNVVLKNIRNTCDNLIAEMYDLSDKRLGMEMTTVKKNKEEWQIEFEKYWSSVEFIQSKESLHRYIFICKK